MLAIGPGFQPPSYNDLRENYLGDCKKECSLLVGTYRLYWAKFGCTINVVHVVTDNAANYKAAGKLVHQKYENIYRSPCAAHCMNLILKDIASMSRVRASKITSFVYNHMIFLSWLRKKDGWKEIVRPGATRFATTFITLSSILEHKNDLQALVVSPVFTTHKESKRAIGKVVNSTVLDKAFWDEIEIVVHVVGPLIRLLKIVDSDERPSLPYVYDGIRRARKKIKHMFKKQLNSV